MNNKILMAVLAVLALGAGATFATTTELATGTNSSSNPFMMMGHDGDHDGDHNRGHGGMFMDDHRDGESNDDRKEGDKGQKDEIKSAMRLAFLAKDYNAFVKAFNTKLAEQTVPTAEEFAMMSTKEKQEQAREDAIKSNDYTAFIKAMPTDTTYTPTQAEFTKMVDMEKNHETMKAAVLGGNYEVFKTAFAKMKPTVPTQEEFTKMTDMKDMRNDTKKDMKTETMTNKKMNKKTQKRK